MQARRSNRKAKTESKEIARLSPINPEQNRKWEGKRHWAAYPPTIEIDPMKYNKLSTGVLLFFACALQSVRSQITVSVDMDPGTLGIQNTWTPVVGSPFLADLIVTVGAGGVSSYGISFRFDRSELSLNGSPAATEALPTGMTVNLTPGVLEEDNVDGGDGDPAEVLWFEASTLGTGPASTSFSIGTISFNVVSMVDDGIADITPGFFSLLDGAFDNAGNPVMPTFNVAHVVPEPSTVALLATGSLMGLLWVSRRRSR
jgi:hypothetical protein